ncbi:MAG: sensor histidine kinase [Salinirussus sp.]
MSADEDVDDGTDATTARTVGQLVRYSREVNQSRTVDEVASYALEAAVNAIDGTPSPTIIEVRGDDDLRVLERMSPAGGGDGGEISPLARQAADSGELTLSPAATTDLEHAPPDATVLDPEAGGESRTETAVAAPSVYRTETDDAGAVVVLRWSSLPALGEHHVKPLAYLADHVATAVNNIRARERLERVRTDLAKRKETIEVYDRLLRHDLGNDLQVVTGYTEILVDELDADGPAAEYAETINRTARSAADLIDRVGELVRTLDEEPEPEARNLRPILAGAVTEAEEKYPSLAVEFDSDATGGQVYAGDLLDSVFTNILSNAAAHNEGGVTVRVFVEEPAPDRVVVGFADDGAGVDESVRDELFEMGTQGPGSDGTGFGLGLARALTESYGGTIELAESDAGGAEFRVTLERV